MSVQHEVGARTACRFSSCIITGSHCKGGGDITWSWVTLKSSHLHVLVEQSHPKEL